MAAKELNPQNFAQETQNGWVLVDFWAPWCGPCRMLSPIIDQVAQSVPQVKFCKVNTQDYPQLAQQFNITAIPAVFLLKDGKIVDSFVGVRQQKDIEAFIKRHLQG